MTGMDKTEEAWEYKVVKAPMNNPRARARALNRGAADGWEMVETTRGALLSTRDQVTLRRPKGHVAAARAAKVAAYEAMTPRKRRAYLIAWGVLAVVIVIGLIAVNL